VTNLKNRKLLMALGKRVRKLREEKGISMRHLAADANIEYSQIAKIETGKINTTVTTADAIARALNIALEDLFKGL
jgi:transcriptional regulator with XRE-family HTH domain